MKLRMYAIHDSATKNFLPPDFLNSDEECIRKFRLNVNRQENGHLFSSPEYFSVHFIGYFDTESGLIEARAPEVLITGAQSKAMKSKNDEDNQLRMAGT